MNELISKLSSYHVFNYLLPGILFTIIVHRATRYDLTQPNILVSLFVYYFIGLVVSRFGSLIIEPVLKRVSFLKFSHYGDFIEASQKDAKIEILLEIGNMYRTLCSLFILTFLLKLYSLLESKFPRLVPWDNTLLCGVLLLMFLLSYRKQMSYISKRVQENAAGRIIK